MDMHEATGGGFTVSNEVTLEDIAREDRARNDAMSRHNRDAMRRGNKGSRTWGYMVPGTGKRRR